MKISRRTYDQLRQQRRELILEKKDLQRTVLTMGNDLLKLRQEYGNVSAAFLQLSAMYFDLVDTVKKCSVRELDTGVIYEMVVRGAELFFNDCAVPGAAEKMDAAKKASEAEAEQDEDELYGPDENDEDVVDGDDEDGDGDITDYIPTEVRKILAQYQKRN